MVTLRQGEALVGPKAHDEGTIDLEEFFSRQRPYFYGAVVACIVLSLFANLAFLKTPNAALPEGRFYRRANADSHSRRACI